ncbi:hypothetical protein O6H91_02G017900 [Diphasiastrum complanatum]|uniref:Uncharacterized protein n=2 Tax=Diphasiastrum complanatum TaxID=34168 RepID=A0ACC2ED07_DIPCM|nr:hypothetical protein O6H91_02G017900 [Diphasiastrum complanatum]KAJ7564451.1 hypothetical protein O6H91_02G017900 [Diphasiastrum complanatum]
MAAFRLPSRDYGPGPGPVCPYCSRIHHPFCSPLPPSLNPSVSHRLYNPAPSNLGSHSSLPPHHSSNITPTPALFPGRSIGGHGGAGLEAFEADPLLNTSFRPQYAPPFPRSAESYFPAIPSSHHPRFPSPIRSQNHELLYPASWHPPMGQTLEDSSHVRHQPEHVDRNPESSSLIKFQGNDPTVLSGEAKRAGGEWLVEEDRFRVHSASLIGRVSVTPQRFLDQQPRFLDEFDRYPGAGLPRGHGQHLFENAERGSLSGVRAGAELSSGFAHDSSQDFLAERFGKYRGFGREGTVGFGDGEVPQNRSSMVQGEMARDAKRFYEESLQDHGKDTSKFKTELGSAESLQAVQDTGERWIDRRDPTRKYFSETGEHGLLQNRTSLDKYEKEGGFQRAQQLWNHSLITARRPDAPVEELMRYSHVFGAGPRHDPSDLGDPYNSSNKIAGREVEFQDSSLVHLNSHQTRIPLYVTKTSSTLEQHDVTREPVRHLPPKSVWGEQYDRNDPGMQVQERDELKKAPASREEELLIEHGLLEDSPEDISYHPTRPEPNLSFWSERERTLHEERHPIDRGADLKRGGPLEVLQVGTRMAEFQKYDSVPRSLSNTDRLQREVRLSEHSHFSDERIRSEQQSAENFLSSSTEEYNLLHVEKVLPPDSRDYTSSTHFPLGDSNPFRHHHNVNVSPAAGLDVNPFLEQVPLYLEDSRQYQLTSSQPSNQFRVGSLQLNRFQEGSGIHDVNWKEKFHPEPSKQVDEVHTNASEQQMHRPQQGNQQIQAHNQPYSEHANYISRQVPLEQQKRLQQPTSFQTHPQRHVKQETQLQKHRPIHQPKLSEPSHLHRKESVSHLPYYSRQSDIQGSGLPGQSASQEKPDLPSHVQHQYNLEDDYLHRDLGKQHNFASNQILNQRQDIQVQSLLYEHHQISASELILSNQQEQAHDLQQTKHFQYQQKLTQDSLQRLQTGQQTHVHMQQQEPQPHIETQGRGLLQSSNHQHQDVAQQISHNPKVLARQGSPGLSSFLQQQQQQQAQPPSSMQRVHTSLEGQYSVVPQGGSLHDSFLSGSPDGHKPFSAAHIQPPFPPLKAQQPPFCTPLQSVHIYPPLPPKVANAVVPPPPPSPPPAPPSPPPLPSSPPKLNVGISHPGNGASGMASSLLSASHLSDDIQDTSMVLQYQHSQENLMQFSQPATIQGSPFQMMTHGQGSQLLHRMPFGHFGSHPQNLPPKIIQQQETSRIVDAVNIFRKPGRAMRPERFVIILRGLPGSGKSYLAKALRDVEVMNGGNAPRIHSMDDYFMAEVEEDQADGDGSTSASTYRGKKRLAKKVMKYCYEPEMEEIYRASMLRAFKKTLEEGMFSFIIVDDRNILVADFAQFWAIAKRTGYEVYVLEATYKDPGGCAARNVHDFTLEQVQKMAECWEPTPQLYLQLDVSSLFRGDDLNAQEITEVEMDADDLERDIDERDDEFMPSDPGKESPLTNGTNLLISSDKWNDSDLKQEKLLRKRKRMSTQLDTSSNSTGSNEDASNALSGLMKAYGKKDKFVRWGDLQVVREMI